MIIFLYGPDSYRSRQKLSELRQKFIKEIDKTGLNIAVLSQATLNHAEAEKAILAMPFLATKRMVIIENLLRHAKTKKIQQQFIDLLEQKNSEQCIVVVWEDATGHDATADKKSAPLFKKLRAQRYAQYFDRLKPPEMARWISAEFKQRGGAATPEAILLLANLVGDDLWQANNEIDKLIGFSHGTVVTDRDVAALVNGKIDDDIFRLTNALGERDRRLALVLIARQLKSGTPALELLSKMAWQVKNLLIIKSFMETNGQGYPAERIGQQLAIHPFVVKKTLPQVARYSLVDLKKMYQHILEIDYKIKTSQINPEVLFDLLVMKS